MILVDFSQTMYRNVFMNLSKIEDNINFFYHVVLQNLIFYKKKFNASKNNKMIICVDSPSWRRKFFKENKDVIYDEKGISSYKGNRKRSEISVGFDKVFSMSDEIIEFLDNYTDWIVLKVPYAEADDIIAVLTKNFDEDTVIISNDKDFKQLFRYRDNIIIFDPNKNVVIDKQKVGNPDLFLKKLIIMGDRQDGILPIINRCGEKTAEKIIKQGLKEFLLTNPEARKRYKFNEILISFDKIPKKVEEKILEEFERKAQERNYSQLKIIEWLSKRGLKKISENVEHFKLGV